MPILFVQKWGTISFKHTGEIGDTIGGITAPFLGFFGSILVYIALKAQIKANKLVQKQFKKQQQIEYKQNFESTFFNLLSIHHQIISDIDFETNKLLQYEDELERYFKKNDVYTSIYQEFSEKDNLTSRDVFKSSLRMMFCLIEDDLFFDKQIPIKYYDENDIEKYKMQFEEVDFKWKEIRLNSMVINSRFKSIYNWAYSQLSSDFGHYFRNLYRMMKMIDEQIFIKDQIKNFQIQYSYTSIIRSQLSDAEIKWIFFNCISNKGDKKFKPLLEIYNAKNH